MVQLKAMATGISQARREVHRFIQQPAQQGLRWVLRWKQKHPGIKEFILIACMPKSGSTFLANALSQLTGYRYAHLTYAYERSEQNLYLPKLIDSSGFGSVTHIHLRATEATLDLLKMFSVKPVILVRNIFDIVVSIRDHMFNEGYEFPTFYCDDGFKTMDVENQYDFIIEQGLPWYFNFYVSWIKAIENHRVEALWLVYDEMISDWDKTLKQVADFYHIPRTDGEIADALQQTIAINKKKTRLNKGISGRSRSALTEDQRRKIARMARFYPDVDFSPIGIDRE